MGDLQRLDGRLSGTPTAVGFWTNIRISVSDGVEHDALPAFSIRATSRNNVAPTISGTPATSVVVGTAYGFVPTASDANGDPLRFSISNKPVVGDLQHSTGPAERHADCGNVGTYSDIVISVSDGGETTSLPLLDHGLGARRQSRADDQRHAARLR